MRRFLKFFLALRGLMGSLAGRLYLHAWGVKFGPGLRMQSVPVCYRHPKGQITLGSSVAIINTMRENLAGVTHPTVLVCAGEGAILAIGNHVGISGAVLYCSTNVTIEDHVQIGAGVRIYDTDFHPIDALQRRHNIVEAVPRAAVHIGHDVWIGACAMVLKGVTIGANSVIAAGAVVVRDVPPNSVVAGVPARVVRRLETAAMGDD